MELQKQSRLIEEQTITTQEAFEAGLNIAIITSDYLRNGNKDFQFHNPYVSAKLNIAFFEGVQNKISQSFPNESIWMDKIIASVKNKAIEKRNLIIETEEKSFSGKVDLFLDPIQINFGNISVDFGVLSTSFSVEVEEHSGTLKVQNFSSNISSNPLVFNVFNDAFDIEDILTIVNQEQRRFIRLESILAKQIHDYSLFIENQITINQKIKKLNLKTKFVYLLILFGFLLPPFLWILAYYIADGKWKLLPSYNIKKGNESLKVIRDCLDEIKTRLNNFSIDHSNNNLLGKNQELLYGAQWCLKRDMQNS
jgi:hypothetical protein